MAKPSAPLRHAVGRVLRNSGPLRELRAQLRREQVQRADGAATLAKELRGALQRQVKQVEQLTSTVKSLQQRIRPVEQEGSLRELDHLRLTSQVGAIEERLGRLEQRLEDGPLVTDDVSGAEARKLLDEVRREHEQIRVRMQIISWYEERLRRVETSVTSMFDGDVRHPV